MSEYKDAIDAIYSKMSPEYGSPMGAAYIVIKESSVNTYTQVWTIC